MRISIIILFFSFFFFDVIITYHIQLYFLFLFLLLLWVFKSGKLSNTTYLLTLVILFFWGYALSFDFFFNYDLILYYIYI